MKRVVLALAALFLGACASRVALREPVGVPTDPSPLERRLREYNAGPEAVRSQGKLRAEGRGSAEFGARVSRGVGLRLDAVAGPFSTPVFSVACRAAGGVGCEAYLPSRRAAYRQERGAWGPWLETLLLGRAPEVGAATGALLLPDGRRVLVLEGRGGWHQEVGFTAGDDLPYRVSLSRWGEPRAEITYGDYVAVDGRPFPGRVGVRVARDGGGYVLEFRRVAPDVALADDTFTLTLPPGTVVESAEGLATWNQAQIPFWLPGPDG